MLSNFEATSNYQDVQDPAITVLFKLRDEDAYLAAWTTTPWTLPSNLGGLRRSRHRVCEGARSRRATSRSTSPKRGSTSTAKTHDLEVHARRARAATWSGGRYEPLFPYFAEQTRAGRVRRADGRLRHHRSPAPASCTGARRSAKTTTASMKAAGIEAFACPVDAARRVHRRSAGFRRALRQGRRQGHHQAAEGLRRAVSSRTCSSTAIRSASARTRRSSTARSRRGTCA